MKRFATRWRLRASGLAVLAALSTACVTRGTFDRVEHERDGLAADKRRLEERVRMLEASAESLDSERVALIEQMESLQQAHDTLDADVRKLREAEKQLSESLSQREAELATRNQEVNQLRGTYDGLVSDLESEVAAGQIAIQQLREGLRLDMQEDVLFASGSSDVNKGGQGVLAKVAERLKSMPNRIVVSGHTDDVPIRTARFPSNWELASARATGVVRILAQRGVDASRLSAVSFGEFAPAASNDTPEGRLRNRRIEILLQPQLPHSAAAGVGGAPPASASAR
jgi:chemotaxis protein MotB